MASFIGQLLGREDQAVPAERQKRRNFSGNITPGEPASDPLYEAVKGDAFSPENSYFSVRLVEMRLAERGSYVTAFLPMCSCFLRYTYGQAQRDVPFTVGYDMIRAMVGKDATDKGAQNVDFKNIYVARNVPVKPDGLVMYAALCRVADSSFARSMLDLLGDAAGVIGGPAAGTVVRAGVDMTKRLGTLLGAEGVSTRFGVLDGAALGKSGYRVFAGAGDGALDARELKMEQGQLLREFNGSKTTIDDVDYLVVALEHRPTLVDSTFKEVSTLPFHALWEPVKVKLLKRDVPGASEALQDLTLSVATSPDLVEADRIGLITAYRAQAEDWMKAGAAGAGSLKGGGQASITTRLADAADGKQGPIEKPVASVLNSASRLIRQRRNGDGGAEPLSESALAQTARMVRDELDRTGATWEALSRASARMTLVALNSPL